MKIERTKRPCRFCGDPVAQRHSAICNHCQNYPDQRDRKTADLYNQFTLRRAPNGH